jgi:glycosyltransferase involved in cell wall biosynthesis
MPQRLIYFVKLARFSNTNAYVEEQLRLRFPEASIVTIDLKVLFKRPSWALMRALAAVTAALGLRALRGRMPKGPLSDAVAHGLLRTPVMFDAMSRYAVKDIERNRADVWFSLQTQSLWNSAAKGIPNFVYTDSTALVNLYYRNYNYSALPRAEWLTRERGIYSTARKTLVMSNHVARSLVELYGLDSSRVARILVGANLREIPGTPAPAPAENKTILFVGLDWERKGGPQLVEAFRRLPSRHSDARLVIVGVSPDLAVPRCEAVGRVPAEKVASYYRQSAIFCMPTHIEPFGIVFIEAMMHGVAVVAPRQGAVVDYIQDRVTGVLHDPGEVEDIARALTWLLDNPPERQAVAMRGFHAVRDAYVWDAVGRKMRDEIIAAMDTDPRPDPPPGMTKVSPLAAQVGLTSRRDRLQPG